MSDSIKKLAGQTVIYGLGTIVPRFLNYLLTPILTYIFTAAEFGINSELFAYISFLNVVFTYGMETTFFNFTAKAADDTAGGNSNTQDVFSTGIVTLAISTAALGIPLLLASKSIAEWLSTPNAEYLTSFIVWSVLIIMTDAMMAVPFARLRSKGAALKFSMLKLFNVAVNFGLTIFFVVACRQAYLNHPETGLGTFYQPSIGIGYVFLANLIANILTLLLLTPQFRGVAWRFNKQLTVQMLSYAWPLLILGLAGMVNETLDRILLKRLIADKEQAQIAQGIYGACYKVAILMTIFIQAFRFASEPFFFGKSREKDSRQTYALVMKYFIIFCLILFLLTVFNLPWIQYLVGEEFRSGLKVVPILLFANLCLGVVYNLSIWYKLSGNTGYGAAISIVGAVVTVVVNVIFVPRYSYMACAWATLASYGSMMLLSYLLGQKYFPIKYNLRAIGFYTAVAVTVYLAGSALTASFDEKIRLAVNNLLIILFVVLIYKMEINTLNKARAHANSEN